MTQHMTCLNLKQTLEEYREEYDRLTHSEDRAITAFTHQERIAELTDKIKKLEEFFEEIKRASITTLHIQEIESAIDSVIFSQQCALDPKFSVAHSTKPCPELLKLVSSSLQENKVAKMGLFGTRPVQPIVNAGNKLKKNKECICGSGKKFKNCCLNKHLEQRLIASNSKEQKDATDSS